MSDQALEATACRAEAQVRFKSGSLSFVIRISLYSSMRIRVLALLLFLFGAIVAEATSHSFVCKASGRLGGPIRFEFHRGSNRQPKTDIKSFSVSMRTDDDRWKAMWSIAGRLNLKQPIQYGVTPAGFTTMIKPQKLIPGRVYAAAATDEHGSSGVTFGFDKDGTMIFPDSFEQ